MKNYFKKVAIERLFHVQNHYYRLLVEKHQIKKFKNQYVSGMIDVTIILAKQRDFVKLKINIGGVLAVCPLVQYDSLFLK